MSVEFISSNSRRRRTVEDAILDYTADLDRPINLETEVTRLRHVVAELVAALSGVLPNEVLTQLCGGSGRGTIHRDGSPDNDVYPLEIALERKIEPDQLNDILREEFREHRSQEHCD